MRKTAVKDKARIVKTRELLNRVRMFTSYFGDAWMFHWGWGLRLYVNACHDVNAPFRRKKGPTAWTVT
jgi:hypothetical protein